MPSISLIELVVPCLTAILSPLGKKALLEEVYSIIETQNTMPVCDFSAPPYAGAVTVKLTLGSPSDLLCQFQTPQYSREAAAGTLQLHLHLRLEAKWTLRYVIRCFFSSKLHCQQARPLIIS